MNTVLRRVGCRADRSQDGGYVAVMTAMLLIILMGIAAFAVDVGRWYVIGQQEQRAADAAALAGVTSLPGDPAGAYASAQKFSKFNGFDGSTSGTTVTAALDGHQTRLRVTVTKTVTNIFGPLLGVPTTKVTRTAVADYTGPVPLASPCNEFGNDPDAASHRSLNCKDTGAFWANVGSPNAGKISGDAYQDNVCAGGVDGCSGPISAPNTDYDKDGYFYTVTVSQPVTDLQIQLFDPAQIVVGDLCDNSAASLDKAVLLGDKADVGDASTRYVKGNTGTTAEKLAAAVWCTGDTAQNGTDGLIKTLFKVYKPGINAWDPLSWPTAGCERTFNPFSGDLSKALDHTLTPAGAVTDTKGASKKYMTEVAETFRRWVPLCTFAGTVPAGTYAIQVKTNGLGTDDQGGHNRFGIRAFGSGSNDKDNILLAGFNKMAMYGNTPGGTSKFFLARVPSGAKGQLFNVHLFDIGDGAAATGSTIKVLPPNENGSSATFAGCTGAGVVNGSLGANCQIGVSSAYNGKWQTISVPIPANYTCDDVATTGCWLRLEFNYGSGSNPLDTTSWTASIDGDPVRLVE